MLSGMQVINQIKMLHHITGKEAVFVQLGAEKVIHLFQPQSSSCLGLGDTTDQYICQSVNIL